MRVLPPPPPPLLGMGEEGGSREEEDRGRYLIAEPMLQVVWLGILLRYGLMMSRSTLVGLMSIHPLPLEAAGVDEEEGVEQEDVEDLL